MNSISYANDWKAVNQAIVEQHIQPRYKILSAQIAALNEKTQSFCQKPNPKNLNTLKNTFNEAMDSWVAVQHLRHGPIELFERYHRIQFWPDKHGVSQRQINTFLAKKDSEILKLENFQNSSVAIQGLSTFEYLLYPKNAKDVISSQYRCQMMQAIAQNIHQISNEVTEEWQDEKKQFKFFFDANAKNFGLTDGKVDYANQIETATVFYLEMHTQIQSIIDQKILDPLGENNKPKMKKSESWRSDRSLQNIETSLKALEDLYTVGFAQKTDSKLNAEILASFQNVYKSLQPLKPSFNDAVTNPKERQDFDNLISSLRDLQRLVFSPLSQALEIPIGFNSLDGD